MALPKFTYAQQQAEGGERRRWFDVPLGSLPPVFYLPLYSPISVKLAEPSADAVRIRVARYERVPRGCWPDKMNNLNVYEYKGDEFR